ncbi:hypothetical protein BT96DRAFT_942993 [Gymnopus androsaceus JB14]|uniref:Uncharacterized protein n=1 Tax=Gymnopus androsaceus JB14 TaxID=1447944 RepID=A0A6A4HA76_9AGAR|nr:hypothetical protein BT96DRAFT_942993 [Gymnopus androsaceus JB14]
MTDYPSKPGSSPNFIVDKVVEKELHTSIPLVLLSPVASLLGITVAHPTMIDALGHNGTLMMDTVLRNTSTMYTVSVGGVVNSESLTTQAAVIADAYAIDNPFFELFFTPSSTVLEAWAHFILPLSRGTICINTTNPSIDPVPDAQYLTVDANISVAVAAARRISSIAVTPPFNDLITETALAESGVPSLNATDKQVKEWVLSKRVIIYAWHPLCREQLHDAKGIGWSHLSSAPGLWILKEFVIKTRQSQIHKEKVTSLRNAISQLHPHIQEHYIPILLSSANGSREIEGESIGYGTYGVYISDVIHRSITLQLKHSQMANMLTRPVSHRPGQIREESGPFVSSRRMHCSNPPFNDLITESFAEWRSSLNATTASKEWVLSKRVIIYAWHPLCREQLHDAKELGGVISPQLLVYDTQGKSYEHILGLNLRWKNCDKFEECDLATTSSTFKNIISQFC